MKLETWIYPWDIAALGVDNVLAEMQALGLDGLRVASNYHPIGALSARAKGKRLLYTEQGAVFFPARLELYERLRPQVWEDPEVIRVWPLVAERAQRYGLELSAWTIGMFQPWLTHQAPDTARVTPLGDRIPSMACPGNADIRAFFTAMCTDLARHYPVKKIHLEGISFHHFDYGWVRPRILLELSPWANHLLSLCFCNSCIGRGEEQGIDMLGLRQRIRAQLDAEFAGDETATDPTTVEDRRAQLSQEDPDFAAYQTMREDIVVEFIRTLAAALNATGTQCHLGVWSPIEVDGSCGVNLARVMDVVGSVLVWKPGQRLDAARRIRELIRTSNSSVQLSHFQACGWPHGATSPEVRREMEAAWSLPVDDIAFYNYGLLQKISMQKLIELARTMEGNHEAQAKRL